MSISKDKLLHSNNFFGSATHGSGKKLNVLATDFNDKLAAQIGALLIGAGDTLTTNSDELSDGSNDLKYLIIDNQDAWHLYAGIYLRSSS